MKIVLQRVLRSSVTVDDEVVGVIGRGLTILFGAEKGDTDAAVDALAEKVVHLRIFADDQGKMNLSCLDVQGDILVVSQFTLAGDCSRGRRPGFDNAAAPEDAQRLYQKFIGKLAGSKLNVQAGRFGAHMQVDIVNDGPVTLRRPTAPFRTRRMRKSGASPRPCISLTRFSRNPKRNSSSANRFRKRGMGIPNRGDA